MDFPSDWTFGMRVDKIDELLQNDSLDVNKRDKLGSTPLHLICGGPRELYPNGENISWERKRIRIIRQLLDKQCDVNLANWAWHRPLHYLAEHDYDCSDAIQELLRNSAGIDTPMNIFAGRRRTALMLAVNTGIITNVKTLIDADESSRRGRQYSITPAADATTVIHYTCWFVAYRMPTVSVGPNWKDASRARCLGKQAE